MLLLNMLWLGPFSENLTLVHSFDQMLDLVLICLFLHKAQKSCFKTGLRKTEFMKNVSLDLELITVLNQPC